MALGLAVLGGWAFHTPEGYEQFASDAGLQAAIETGTVWSVNAERLLLTLARIATRASAS